MKRKDFWVQQRQHSLFPPSLFFVYLGVLLLMSGLHTGLLVGMDELGWPSWIQVYIPIFYWGAVAVGLTLFTRRQIRKTYEEPMLKLAQATRQVAEGDFSIYVSPTHTADRADYLDQMILDFDKKVEELGSIETLKTDFFSDVSHEFKSPLRHFQQCGNAAKGWWAFGRADGTGGEYPLCHQAAGKPYPEYAQTEQAGKADDSANAGSF